MNTYFPFHALGLQCNPFRALTDEEWGEIALLPEELLTLDPAAHVQVLGERGHGKTSLLMGLAALGRRQRKKTAYEYLPAGQNKFTTRLAGLDLFLLDEAQRLGRGEWGRLLAGALAASAPRLVVSSHEDVAPLFASHHLDLRTIHLTAASVDLLRAVVQRRLTYFALPGGPGIAITSEAIDYLHQRFGGNLRAAEHLLYEVCQHLPGPGEITAEHLAALKLPPEPAPWSAAP